MKIQLFDFTINVLKSLLWRHNNAENLQALLADKQAALDTLNKDFWEGWIDTVFNLDNTSDFGLAVLAKILDIPLTLEASGTEPDNSNWGFGAFRKNFYNGSFTSLGGGSSLNNAEAKSVLRLRYYQLVTRGNVPEINKIMADVLGDVYVLDNLDMTMTYIFNDLPTSTLRDALDKFDILPRPSAVELNTVFQPNVFYGFGPFRKNFNNGNFRS